VWQGDRRVEVPSHPLERLIDRGCNRHQSWQDWAEWVMASVLLRGNAVSEIVLDARGALIELRPIEWDRISIVDLPGDQLGLDITDNVRGGKRRLLEGEVFWIKDRSDDGKVGVSRLTRAAGVVGQAQALAEFTASMWKHGTHPSGALQTDSVLSDTARANLAKHMKEWHTGPRNAARFLLLESGLKWQSLTINPEDAELLESRAFTVAELCRIYGVPPPLVQDYSHNTFTNSQEAPRRSLFSAAAAVDHQLVLDMSDLLRGSPLERWQANKLAVESGVLDPDEIRTQEGFPPRAAPLEGDVATQTTASPSPVSRPNGAAADMGATAP
jgi:HK97 family phage portal protein